MNKVALTRKRRAISPIIATLLLILIAIAAGVVVYAYVIGFIGNSTSNTGNNTSVISIDNACVAVTAADCGSKYLSVTVRNVGSTSIPAPSDTVSAAVYLSDVTSGSAPAATVTCLASATSVSPGATYTCTATAWTTAPSNAGDLITIKVVNPDGGAATTSVKSIA